MIIYDVTGRMILENLNENESDIIDLGAQPDGMYIYEVIDKGGKVSRGKLLKCR
jgi:hypothetical protein